MKKRSFKIVCMVTVICMLMSVTPIFAYDTNITPESPQINADICCDETVLFSTSEVAITPMGVCLLGHWLSLDDKTTIKHSYNENYQTPCTIYWAKRCTNCDTITSWVAASNTCTQHR